MRVTLDANIHVSALVNAHGAPAQAMAAYRAGRFTLVTSEPLLAEVERVLRYPRIAQRGVTEEQVQELIALLRSGAELVPVTGTVTVCRDSDDDAVIETAITGKVDLVVTGDPDLHDPKVTDFLAAAGIRVIKVSLFVRMLQLMQPAQAGRLFTDWDIKP